MTPTAGAGGAALPVFLAAIATGGLFAGAACGALLLRRLQRLRRANRRLARSAQRHAHELRQLAQKHRALMGRSEDAVLVWEGRTLEILEANARAGELLRLPPRRLIGRSFEGYLEPPMRNTVTQALRRVPDSGAVALREVGILPNGGGRAAVELSVCPIRFEADELASLAILRDLTPRRALARKAALLSDQLLETEKIASIGVLAAGVAHEVNNPIGYVASNLNRLIEYTHHLRKLRTPSGEEVEADGRPLDALLDELEEIALETREGVQRVTEIVQALLEFARGGRPEAASASVDVNRVTRNCLILMHNQIKSRARVKLDLRPLPPVHGHATQIGQVVMNLVLNAAQAMDEPGTIRISSYDSGDRIHLAVEDDGAGIPPEHIAQVFEPFFTTRPTGTGTGLGLAVSREIVRRHSGELTVDSVPGRGTRFLLELPCDPPPDPF